MNLLAYASHKAYTTTKIGLEGSIDQQLDIPTQILYWTSRSSTSTRSPTKSLRYSFENKSYHIYIYIEGHKLR